MVVREAEQLLMDTGRSAQTQECKSFDSRHWRFGVSGSDVLGWGRSGDLGIGRW